MKNYSIWEKEKIKNEELKDINNLNTDILIIGGGITGISTAYFLMNQEKKVTIIDKSNIGMGITSKTSAKLNYLQGTIYQKLEKNFNRKTSKTYLDSQIEAIELIKKIVKKENIDCNLEKCDSFIFTKDINNIKKINKEKEILESFNIKCSIVDKLPIHFPIKYGIFVNDTYTFHPLKYINGLRKSIEKKIDIYENIMALEIIPKENNFIIKTTKGIINAKYVIITCHYPFFILPGLIPIKTYIEREYINSSNFDLENSPFTALSIDSTLHSIRFYKDHIIYGSNKHRLTNKIKYKENYEQSKIDFKRLFSKEPEYTWMNQDIISNDDLPIIGIANKKHPTLLIATAFNKWGMTNGTIAGKVLSDIILKNDNKYVSLFNPTRVNLTNIINSIIGIFYYSKVYSQTTIKKNPVFCNDHVYIIKINGHYYGVYYDYYGKKHIVKHKCPHMKCNLVFNDEEKTWDCPCHGSRFDIDGKVIEGPANYSISVTDF